MSPRRPPDDDDRVRFPFGHSEEGPLEDDSWDDLDEGLPPSESPTQLTGDALPRTPAQGWSGMGAAPPHESMDLGSLPLDSFEGMPAYPGGFGSLDSSADHDFSRYTPNDDPSADQPAFESEEGVPLIPRGSRRMQDSWDSGLGDAIVPDSDVGVIPEDDSGLWRPRSRGSGSDMAEEIHAAGDSTRLPPKPGGASGGVSFGSERLPAGTEPFELRKRPLDESGPFELNEDAKRSRERDRLLDSEDGVWGEPLTRESSEPARPAPRSGPQGRRPQPSPAAPPPGGHAPRQAPGPPPQRLAPGPPPAPPPRRPAPGPPPGPPPPPAPRRLEGDVTQSAGWRAQPQSDWDESAEDNKFGQKAAWTEPSSEWGADSLAGTQETDAAAWQGSGLDSEAAERGSKDSGWEDPIGWGGFSSATHPRPEGLDLPPPGTIPGPPPPPAPNPAGRRRPLPGQNDPTPPPSARGDHLPLPPAGTKPGPAPRPAPTGRRPRPLPGQNGPTPPPNSDPFQSALEGQTYESDSSLERAPTLEIEPEGGVETQTGAWANIRPDRTMELDPEEGSQRALSKRSQLDESQETPIVLASASPSRPAASESTFKTEEDLIDLPPSEASLVESRRLPQGRPQPPRSRRVPAAAPKPLPFGDESDDSFNLDAPSESKWEVFQSEGFALEDMPGRPGPPPSKRGAAVQRGWGGPLPSEELGAAPRGRAKDAPSELRGPTIGLDDDSLGLDSHSLLLAELGGSAGILSEDVLDESALPHVGPVSDQGFVSGDESWEGLALADDEAPQSVAERVSGLWQGDVLWALLSAGAVLTGPVLIAAAWSYYGLEGPARRFHSWHLALNANSFLGLYAGLGAAILVLLNLNYIIRRRLNWFNKVSMRTWLNVHMICGILAGSLALVHSGLEASNIPARICAFAMAFAIASGLFGRYVLAHVPRRQEGDLASRAQLATLLAQLRGDLRRQLTPYPQLRDAALTALSEVEVQKPKRGLGMVWDLFLGDVTQRRRELTLGNRFRDLLDLEVSSDGELEALLNETLELIHLHGRVNRRLSHFEGIRDLMDSWRGLHMILALIMVGALVVHVTIGFLYGNLRWGAPSDEPAGVRAPQEPGQDEGQ